EFVVHLPRRAESDPLLPAKAAGEAAQPSRSGRAARILVAEDSGDARESLATWLRLSGHEVVVAADGLEALAIAERERPEVLVLDIGMPRLNGYELAVRLRAFEWAADALLIAMTGWGQEDDRRRSREAGFDLHLTKPFDPDRLLEILKSGGPARRDSNPRPVA